MAPLVRDDKRALEGKETLIRQGLEEERIGHAVHRHAPKIKIEERSLRAPAGGAPRHAQLALHAIERRGQACPGLGQLGPPLVVRDIIETIHFVHVPAHQIAEGLDRDAVFLKIQLRAQRLALIIQPPGREEPEIHERGNRGRVQRQPTQRLQ